METRTFDLLTPHAILDAVESAYGLRLDGTLSAYHSYVNRVFAVAAEEGAAYVAKFYRPGRWTEDAILDEHQFVEECAGAELPVAVPLPDADGVTLQSVELEAGDAREDFYFALYERRGGLAFDAERDEDWRRLGGLVGRMHGVAVRSPAPHRLECLPGSSSAMFLDELDRAGVVHPTCEQEFFALAREALSTIAPLFDGVPLQRIHGDCHRGNILDRPGEGLLLIDFDDMMNGPAVQDLWLLLPERAAASRRELSLILEGYGEFRPVDRGALRLIEPLRLMRMLYYLAWSARQRGDRRFIESNPGWGSEAFWIREIEDLRDQREAIERES
jgi:Ser/Thr protein kinase RdoA (MazF antagonist)